MDCKEESSQPGSQANLRCRPSQQRLQDCGTACGVGGERCEDDEGPSRPASSATSKPAKHSSPAAQPDPLAAQFKKVARV